MPQPIHIDLRDLTQAHVDALADRAEQHIARIKALPAADLYAQQCHARATDFHLSVKWAAISGDMDELAELIGDDCDYNRVLADCNDSPAQARAAA